MRKMNIIVMTLAGLLLMVATVLKIHEMLSICVPSWDANAAYFMQSAEKAGETLPAWKANIMGFWESYEFLLLQIPLEFALGVWMVSGLFRKAAWIAGTLGYFGFIVVTLVKALIGLESCGCFGRIEVDPWITLWAVDVPLFLLLAIFRPKGTKLLPPPWPNTVYLLAVFVITVGLMVVIPPALVAFRPDCLKAEAQQPDASAQLKLQNYQLKQQLQKQTEQTDALRQQAVNAQLTIRRLEQELKIANMQLKEAYDVNEIKIADVGFYDSKALLSGAKFHVATQVMPGGLMLSPTDEPDVFEISVNEQVLLLLNLSEQGKMILIPGDLNSQEAQTPETQKQIESVVIQQPENQQQQPAEPETDSQADQQVEAQTNEVQEQTPDVEQWDWLQYVVEDEVREQLSAGLAVILMYHHDCPTCTEMVPKYSAYDREMTEQGVSAFKIAFLAVPPYGETTFIPDETTCILGKLTDQQKWEVTSPYVVALLDGELVKTWPQGTAPEPENILDEIFGQ